MIFNGLIFLDGQQENILIITVFIAFDIYSTA